MDNRTIQRALQAKGYYQGEIDGVLGPQSLAGIAAAIEAAPVAKPDKSPDSAPPSHPANTVDSPTRKTAPQPDKKPDSLGGMNISRGRLYRIGGAIPFISTPNQGGALDPSLIIAHDTAGPSAQAAINWFKKPESKVSAHFVVDLDGTITQMVETGRVAWHAGKSVYNGSTGCNAFSVGIEIVNPGRLDGTGKAWFGTVYPECFPCTTKEHGAGHWVRYPAEQVKAVEALCRALVAAHPKIGDIRPHWHVSPGRKVDTNPLYPLEELRAAVLGEALVTS